MRKSPDDASDAALGRPDHSDRRERVRAADADAETMLRCGCVHRQVYRAMAAQHARRLLRHGRPVALGGTTGTGKINEEFDRWFLDCLTKGNIAEATSRYAKYEDLEAVAGNGGHEIRDWLAVAGAMPSRCARASSLTSR